MIPLALPVLPVAADQVALAYRAFDHWLKHEHADCLEEDLLGCCIPAYGRWCER